MVSSAKDKKDVAEFVFYAILQEKRLFGKSPHKIPKLAIDRCHLICMIKHRIILCSDFYILYLFSFARLNNSNAKYLPAFLIGTEVNLL